MTFARSVQWHTAGQHSRLKLLLLTQKHSFNLGSGCTVGSQTICYFYDHCPLLQVEVHMAEVQLCIVHTS
jgi:hypothetical protein